MKPIVVIISANSEWRVVDACYPQPARFQTPYGPGFSLTIKGREVIWIKGGWGKVSAAASAQYAIQALDPVLVVNLGTCGGLGDLAHKGDVILAEETLIYDIYEAMGDPQEAINFYSARPDLSWLPDPLPLPVRRVRLVSADRDIFPTEVQMLSERFGAIASDWESGAIAWVASQNNVRSLILRGVSDSVYPDGGEAYGEIEIFHNGTKSVMEKLLASLPDWVAHAPLE